MAPQVATKTWRNSTEVFPFKYFSNFHRVLSLHLRKMVYIQTSTATFPSQVLNNSVNNNSFDMLYFLLFILIIIYVKDWLLSISYNTTFFRLCLLPLYRRQSDFNFTGYRKSHQRCSAHTGEKVILVIPHPHDPLQSCVSCPAELKIMKPFLDVFYRSF